MPPCLTRRGRRDRVASSMGTTARGAASSGEFVCRAFSGSDAYSSGRTRRQCMARTPLAQALEQAAAETGASQGRRLSRRDALKLGGVLGLATAAAAVPFQPGGAQAGADAARRRRGCSAGRADLRLRSQAGRPDRHRVRGLGPGRRPQPDPAGSLRRQPAGRARRPAHRPGPHRHPAARRSPGAADRQPAPGRCDRNWEGLGCNGETFAGTGYQNTWDETRAQAGRSGIVQLHRRAHLGRLQGSLNGAVETAQRAAQELLSA